MMKDQLANNVVQKILEASTDRHRDVLLSRIRAHLTALKKYTYGKHIVASFELLCGIEEKQTSEHGEAYALALAISQHVIIAGSIHVTARSRSRFISDVVSEI